MSKFPSGFVVRLVLGSVVSSLSAVLALAKAPSSFPVVVVTFSPAGEPLIYSDLAATAALAEQMAAPKEILTDASPCQSLAPGRSPRRPSDIQRSLDAAPLIPSAVGLLGKAELLPELTADKASRSLVVGPNGGQKPAAWLLLCLTATGTCLPQVARASMPQALELPPGAAKILPEIQGAICEVQSASSKSRPLAWLEYVREWRSCRECQAWPEAAGGRSTLKAASGTEAVDYLINWNRAATGSGTSVTWYEGNIKTCNDKGMRLPTAFETNASSFFNSQYLPTDGSPSFTGSKGVPAHSSGNFTWTASGHTYYYWLWNFSGGGGYNFSYGGYVRCVLP